MQRNARRIDKDKKDSDMGTTASGGRGRSGSLATASEFSIGDVHDLLQDATGNDGAKDHGLSGGNFRRIQIKNLS